MEQTNRSDKRETRNRELVTRFQAGDEDALLEFIAYNRPLIIHMWSKRKLWIQRQSEHDEMVASVEIALWRTMKEFDLSYTTKISTFMYYKIMCEIDKVVANSYLIKIPKDVEEIKTCSLTMDDRQFDVTVDDREEHSLDQEDLMKLDSMLKNLKERERNIVKMRFGIGSSQGMTYEAIGNEQGVTKERIRQIINRSLNKMKDSNLCEV